MTSLSLVFDPHLPWPVLLVAAILAALALGWGLWRRAKGIGWRLAFLTLLLLALANPTLRREEREQLPDTVLLVKDRSPSQRLPGRQEQLAEAEKDIRARLADMPGVELREVELDGSGRDGTTLFAGLADALAETDRSRLGAILALTDGEVHDAPADAKGVPAPFHALLTGRKDETDRRLVIEQAPSFSVVGEPQTLTVRVEDEASGPGSIPVTLRRDGKVLAQIQARPGTPETLPFSLDKAGPTVLEIDAATRPGELTSINNRTAVTVNGVRDRLRVLLVSGQPYPGLRVWRNLLKADPSVDLVHFTILRPPREAGRHADPRAGADRLPLARAVRGQAQRVRPHHLRPLLPPRPPAPDLPREHRPLRRGGRRPPRSRRPRVRLAHQPLPHPPLPRPPRRPLGRGLRARLHPHAHRARQAPPGHGRPRLPTVPNGAAGSARSMSRRTDGQVLMTGVSDRPLLVLKRVGEGRVAQLLSDHAWLWQRGFEGGGPQAVLLRRLVHWLMKEPQLEEEALRARAQGDEIILERQSLNDDPVPATLTAPSGQQQTLELRPDPDGTLRARTAATRKASTAPRTAPTPPTSRPAPSPRASWPTCGRRSGFWRRSRRLRAAMCGGSRMGCRTCGRSSPRDRPRAGVAGDQG